MRTMHALTPVGYWVSVNRQGSQVSPSKSWYLPGQSPGRGMAEFGPMNRAVGFIVAAALIGAGCGDNFGPPPLTSSQLLDRLRALPGVTATEVGTVAGPELQDFTYYVLHFTQPVDHDDPSQGYFQQQVSLLHINNVAPTPMIVHTSGYSDDAGRYPTELAMMLNANQVSIEHRYFGSSKPVPTDWSFLTIKQMAKDEQAIIIALKTIYEGAFVTTGASKGGMTAVFHRSFYAGELANQVAGTVAYVAPISFNAPDPRYQRQLDKIGSDDCRSTLRALASRMLVRAPQMQSFAEQEASPITRDGPVYTRVVLGAAVEAAIAQLEWSFWQASGDSKCTSLPKPAASDAELYAFLNSVSPIAKFADECLGYYEAYAYQTYSELGFPMATASYLTQDLTYHASDYLGELPTAPPAYERHWMLDVDSNVENNVDQLVFIYGDWDPWYGGAFATGKYAHKYVVDHGNHMVKIADLAPDKRDAALAEVARWTGVTPVVSRLRRAGSRTTHTGPLAETMERSLPPPLITAAPR